MTSGLYSVNRKLPGFRRIDSDVESRTQSHTPFPHVTHRCIAMSSPAVVAPRSLARPVTRRDAPKTRRRAHPTHRASAPTGGIASPEASTLRDELLALLGEGGEGEQRMARFVDRSRLEQLVDQLEAVNPTPKPFESEASMRLLLNEWQLVTTFKPGTGDVRFTDPESWRKYIFDQGPSPVQSLVVGAGTVDNVFQVLQDPRGSPENGAKWRNVVSFF